MADTPSWAQSSIKANEVANAPKVDQQAAQTASTQLDVREKGATVPYAGPQAGATLANTELTTEEKRIAIDKARKGETLPPALDKKISELADSYQGFRRLNPSFKAGYAGTFFDFPTNIESDLQDRIPSVGDPGQSDWWKDMRTLEITARNAIFGASLQPNEQKAWAETTISPGMSAAAIQRNLQRREDIVREVLSREIAGAKAGGFRSEQIDAKLGRYGKDFTPEATAAFYKRLDEGVGRANETRTEAEDNKVGLLEAPPEGAQVGGEAIKGWRLSREAEQRLSSIMRNGGSAEEYANAVGDTAVAEGKITPEERDGLVAATLPSAQEYERKYAGTPEGRAAIPPVLGYDEVDKAAQDNAGIVDKVAQGVSNVPASAVQLAEGIVRPVGDVGLSLMAGKPVGTTEGLLNLATGDKEAWQAMGDSLAERYLTADGLENALITDPLGILGDASMVFSGGGTAAARLPGVAGRAGRFAQKVGALVDPITGTRKALDYTINTHLPAVADLVSDTTGFVGRHGAGITTGNVGGKPFSRAFEAGKEGGKRGERFRKNLRGDGDVAATIAEAEKAAAQLQADASARYRSGMVDVSQDKTILDFTDIDNALAKTEKQAFYKGEVRDEAAATAWRDAKEIIDDWKTKDPAEFHTPEGMDVLKQKIGDLGGKYEMGNDRNAASVAKGLYRSVRQAVADQVPTYAKTMKDYQDFADNLNEIRTTFSLNPRAPLDTKARKLLSSGRNNVNTNYGRREQLADQLDRLSGGKIGDDVAGQSLSAILPRGIGGPLASLMGGSGAVGTGLSLFTDTASTLMNPANLAYLPLTSPRVMGEAAHGLGRLSRRGGELTDSVIDKVTPTKLLALQERYPTAFLGASRATSALQNMENQQRENSLPPLDPVTATEALGIELTPEEEARILEERRRLETADATSMDMPGFAYGGAVRDLSRKYAKGGPVEESWYDDPANAARTFGSGVTFGFNDEIEAGLRALAQRNPDAYRREVNRIRKEQEDYSERHPYAAVALEGAGSIAPSLLIPGGAAATSARLIPRLAREAGQVALESAAYGAGTADTIADIPRSIRDEAIMGFGMYGAGELGGAGAKKLYRKVRGR